MRKQLTLPAKADNLSKLQTHAIFDQKDFGCATQNSLSLVSYKPDVKDKEFKRIFLYYDVKI